jgi:Fic family protein
VPDSAKMVSRGEQAFDPKTQRIVSKIYGMLSTGEMGVVETTVITVEDFLWWYGLQTQTLAAIHKYNAEALIATMPKGKARKRKPPQAANVTSMMQRRAKG